MLYSLRYFFCVLIISSILLYGGILFFVNNKQEKSVIKMSDKIPLYISQKIILRDDLIQTQYEIYKTIKTSLVATNGSFINNKNKITSENQSYLLLIAVYSGDYNMFNKTWIWTKNNLQTHSEDNLFSWLWQNGKIIDRNSATDADQDIAYALYLAGKKWDNEEYFNESKKIINDIWRIETSEIRGVRYITAGNWATKSNSIIINPSYFAPYEYKYFSILDSAHDWSKIISSSYKALALCSGKFNIARNWCQINNNNRVIEKYKRVKKNGANYSFDALRVPYRIAMDYSISKNLQSIRYLKTNTIFIKDWNDNGKIFAIYNQQGNHLSEKESLASYGAQLASMSLINKKIAQEIYTKKIKIIKSWENIRFYDTSWVLFGINFYINELNKDIDNIAKKIYY